VVVLAGRAGIADCGWLRLLLDRQAEHGPGRVVVDLSRLSGMDWWVALILTWAGRVVSRRGGVLMLAAPQPAVARLLHAAGAPKAVALCASVQQARRQHVGASAASA
jgi:anti-anti-sigma regulatory factor